MDHINRRFSLSGSKSLSRFLSGIQESAPKLRKAALGFAFIGSGLFIAYWAQSQSELSALSWFYKSHWPNPLAVQMSLKSLKYTEEQDPKIERKVLGALPSHGESKIPTFWTIQNSQWAVVFSPDPTVWRYTGVQADQIELKKDDWTRLGIGWQGLTDLEAWVESEAHKPPVITNQSATVRAEPIDPKLLIY